MKIAALIIVTLGDLITALAAMFITKELAITEVVLEHLVTRTVIPILKKCKNVILILGQIITAVQVLLVSVGFAVVAVRDLVAILIISGLL